MRKINKLILHCSASEALSDIDSIRKFHMDPTPRGRGWRDVGYHYVINKNGVIEYGRKEDEIGAHCEGHNKNSIGICVGGDKRFTYAQIKSLRFLVRETLLKYKLKIEHVFMHNELDNKGKTCPNPNDLIRALFLTEEI